MNRVTDRVVNRKPGVLVVEDDETLREALAETLTLAGYRVLSAPDAQAAFAVMERDAPALIVTDVQMPGEDGISFLRRLRAARHGMPVLVMTAYGSIPSAVEAMRAGAADYLIKPFEAEVLAHAVARHLPAQPGESDFVSDDARSRALRELALRVAPTDATVLLSGESGVGKEVLARFIHAHSTRAARSFVAINCAAIPDNMLEAILFGYEKGAYTGAHQASPGKFEQAQGGTLLLDEISEMHLGLQAKLLRVLQEREVERLGSRVALKLDVRVLATTNRNLRDEVRAGRFREDLYYRLNVFPLEVPPLRERAADIVAIAERLVLRIAASQGRRPPRLEDDARDRLRAHTWPGNVRELDNVMQRAVILCTGESIHAGHLHFESAAPGPAPAPATALAETAGEDLRGQERQLILRVLGEERGSRKRTAERLGLSARTLRYKLARLRDAGVAVPEVAGERA
jgi:two-component system response regulator FlrC